MKRADESLTKWGSLTTTKDLESGLCSCNPQTDKKLMISSFCLCQQQPIKHIWREMKRGSWVNYNRRGRIWGPKRIECGRWRRILRALGSLGPVRVGLAWSCETTPEIAACCRSAYQCLASDPPWPASDQVLNNSSHNYIAPSFYCSTHHRVRFVVSVCM